MAKKRPHTRRYGVFPVSFLLLFSEGGCPLFGCDSCLDELSVIGREEGKRILQEDVSALVAIQLLLRDCKNLGVNLAREWRGAGDYRGGVWDCHRRDILGKVSGNSNNQMIFISLIVLLLYPAAANCGGIRLEERPRVFEGVRQIRFCVLLHPPAACVWLYYILFCYYFCCIATWGNAPSPCSITTESPT